MLFILFLILFSVIGDGFAIRSDVGSDIGSGSNDSGSGGFGSVFFSRYQIGSRNYAKQSEILSRLVML